MIHIHVIVCILKEKFTSVSSIAKIWAGGGSVLPFPAIFTSVLHHTYPKASSNIGIFLGNTDYVDYFLFVPESETEFYLFYFYYLYLIIEIYRKWGIDCPTFKLK
uniref:Uncharacterized protein n=1 Tax=Cacopsylla melanoneura TaxID=428564 RepID=A0A8D8UA53_9HEMI